MRGNVERVPDLTNKDVFIPINLNSHWTLALAMYRETTISYFNSMDCLLETEDYNMIRKLAEFFENNYPPGDNSRLTKWRIRNNTNIQAQQNSDDCGVFVLAWTRVIVTDLRYLYQVGKDPKQMPKLRKIFQQELKENQLMKMPFFETFQGQ
ncbi:Oidioi.mRNA.OKI2018_I69.chr2.g6339.t1.cds [Oikopleura dioica]|uniref:Oidioi.mRNA.OKI2018_I69.chr2.g6339.t1.cds n=1 Tax=Oikopleura dioica TaxID=34765 RepID=A0ABN7T2Q7_OIKDI|nr:Oidioi.mRNA.OKI2018_I69.chr2.g6339.t1.cds [Oikopleura dioica]